MFRTVEEFYTNQPAGEPVPQRPAPERQSFKEILLDAVLETIKGFRPERDFEEGVFDPIAVARDYLDRKYSARAAEQLFSDLSSTEGSLALTDVFTYRGTVVAIAIHTNNSDPVILGDPYMVELFNEQLESLPMVGGLLRQTSIGRIRDISEMNFNDPEMIAMLIRAQAAGTMGGHFTTDRDTRDSIDRFNSERPGSDAMMDTGYREVRDRLEGRVGWVNA